MKVKHTPSPPHPPTKQKSNFFVSKHNNDIVSFTFLEPNMVHTISPQFTCLPNIAHTHKSNSSCHEPATKMTSTAGCLQ